ncbi:sugar transferase [Patescibacteria group bacterium]|nr:sugar transferase [Patescibacteria group bacterium]
MNIKKIIILLGDILLMIGTLWLALLIRHNTDFSWDIFNTHWKIFGLLYLLWLPIFYSFSLYDIRANVYVIPLLTNLLRATIFNTIIAIVYFYIISSDTNITPKTILALNIILLTIGMFLWRRIVISFSQAPALEKNIIFIGWDPLIKEMLEDNLPFGYKIKAIFNTPSYLREGISLPIYNDLENLTEVIKKEKIQLIVLTNSLDREVTNKLFNLLKLRINFISLTNFYEQVFQIIPLSIINQSWFLENLSEGNKSLFEILKRLLDIIFAVIFGIISLPFIPLIMLLIYLDSKGPIFFIQTRTGEDGKNFKAIKFRTMYQDSENKGPMWAKENDPRTTKIGRFLRKLRIDEIPQLWNILIGEMSFVGPRPERPEFIEDLVKSIPFYHERLLVKPGLTGWAQINFPYTSTTEDSLKKLQFDLYYIKNRSLILDWGIMLKTLNIILKGSGR